MRCERVAKSIFLYRSIVNVGTKLNLQMNIYLYVGLNVLFAFLVYVSGSFWGFDLKVPLSVSFSGVKMSVYGADLSALLEPASRCARLLCRVSLLCCLVCEGMPSPLTCVCLLYDCPQLLVLALLGTHC